MLHKVGIMYCPVILDLYVRLKNETRWSASFYSYLAAVVAGASGNLRQARELFLQTGKLVKRKNNNLEKFCSRRVSIYSKLYMW